MKERVDIEIIKDISCAMSSKTFPDIYIVEDPFPYF